MIGEFEIIDKISKYVKSTLRKPVLTGIGDDCAVLKYSHGRLLLVSVDTFNEKVHFRREYSTFYEAGVKAVSGGISDISAMGGRCDAVFVAISVPGNMDEGDIMEFYKGAKHVCGYAGAVLAGGDTTASAGCFSATITVVGQVARKGLKLRGGARHGDGVYLTGPTGHSLAGLCMLERNIRPVSPLMRAALKKHRAPMPYLGRLKTGGITSMIDVSDGLSSELNHLSKRSSVRMVLEKTALFSFKGLRKLAGLVRMDPLELALKSGEEYELLFTAGHGFRVGNAIRIGTVSRGSGVFFSDGTEVKPSGYNHFKA